MPWLPAILALSANSPWFERERTGLLSTRAEMLGLLPRHGAPPRFESWADWERARAPASSTRASSPEYGGITGTSGRILGSGRSRSACPTSRPTFADRRLRRARACACRVGAGAAAAPAAAGDRRRVHAEPLGRVPLRPPRAAHPPRARRRSRERADLYAELVERIGVDPLGADACEADAQLAFDDPQRRDGATSCAAR